jgi:hypothetical protein
MAYPTLRENRRSATHQLATTVNQARMRVLVQQAFYQHESLGPGAPLIKITGQGEGDGYYDWAGRRLFHSDGEPDPMCPGAYRYQHAPACCDLEAPDSDPRSPRYEPMHLRHRPGDTWIIDTNRPHDPFDPGPFGSPGWYPDQRTGRHRRDETPDPLPAEGWVNPGNAWFPGTADWPEPEAAQATPPRRSDRDRPRTGDGGNDRRPTPPRSCRPEPAPEAEEPEPDQRGQCRFWNTEHQDTASGEHRFSKLRESSFDRFMTNSATLHAAHYAPVKPYLRERVAWGLRWLLWVLACGLVPMPAVLTAHHLQREPEAPQPIPAQPGPATRPRPIPAESGPIQAEHSEPAPAAPDAADSPTTPGAAIAAAVNGARAARKVIANRETRTSSDLAEAVRDSATHWRAHQRQQRPRPAPRPAPGSYMTAWEQAFDTGHTFILGTSGDAA